MRFCRRFGFRSRADISVAVRTNGVLRIRTVLDDHYERTSSTCFIVTHYIVASKRWFLLIITLCCWRCARIRGAGGGAFTVAHFHFSLYINTDLLLSSLTMLKEDWLYFVIVLHRLAVDDSKGREKRNRVNSWYLYHAQTASAHILNYFRALHEFW